MKKLLPVLGIVLVAIVGGFILFHDNPPDITNIKNVPFRPGCEKNPNPVFSHYPTDIEKVTSIEPPFMEISGNLKGHSYINVREIVPVYAPADSILSDGIKYQETTGNDERQDLDQYLLQFEVSCEVYYYYDHLTDVSEKIAEAFPRPAASSTRTKSVRGKNIQLKAGELIGYSAGRLKQPEHNFDFGVFNRSVTSDLSEKRPGLRSPKYVNGVCPYDYFEGEKKTRLFSLLSYGDASDLVVVDNICEQN